MINIYVNDTTKRLAYAPDIHEQALLRSTNALFHEISHCLLSNCLMCHILQLHYFFHIKYYIHKCRENKMTCYYPFLCIVIYPP